MPARAGDGKREEGELPVVKTMKNIQAFYLRR
jgi:hypothetical protein